MEMNQLFLLKLIAEFLEGDKITPEKLHCARTILNNIIEYYGCSESPDSPCSGNTENYESLRINPDLDDEATKARKELVG